MMTTGIDETTTDDETIATGPPLDIATRTAITTARETIARETIAREMVEAETIANLFAHHMMTALEGERGSPRMIQRSPSRRTRNPRLPLQLQAKK
jgi:hypothetical protein